MLRPTVSKRVYPGENLAYLLLGWLNETGEKKARQRLLCLIETAQQLAEFKPSEGFPSARLNPNRPGLVGTKVQFANRRKASKLARTFNGLLSGYKMFPRLKTSSASSLKVSWMRTRNRHRLNIGIWAGGNYDEIIFGEGDAVASVLRIAEAGYILRLRKCACGRWFYARFQRRRFCGMPCQQRDFRRSEEFRAYRRAYMRDYRMILAKRSRRRFVQRNRANVSKRR